MMRSRCYPLLDVQLRGGKVLRTFLFILRGILFLVTIRKQLTLERATQLVATWQLGCQTRPPFSNVPKCVLSPLTTSLYFVYFFLFRPREESEILLSIGKISFGEEEERERVHRTLYHFQAKTKGWMDRQTIGRQTITLFSLRDKRETFGEEKDSGSVQKSG